MSTITMDRLQQDHLAMSAARALALANDALVAQGRQPAQCLVTMNEEASAAGRVWRIHYGPKDYVGRRGGDWIMVVDEASETVQRIIRGQ